MTTNYSPKIVTTDLVLMLDTCNIKSYPGTGTIFKDLSGNENNSTMFGSVPYEIDIVPCFNFSTITGVNTANASQGFTFSSNMVQRTGDFSFSCWIKNPPASVNQTGLFSNSGSGDGYRFGIGLNGVYFLIGPTYTEGQILFQSTLSASLWYNVVCVFSRTTAQVLIYLNGIFQNLASVPSSQTEFVNATPGLVRGVCCSLYNGKLSTFYVYNKSLSSSEVLQNFNALKSRFNI